MDRHSADQNNAIQSALCAGGGPFLFNELSERDYVVVTVIVSL